MVFHCFLIFFAEKKMYYASIMLDATSIVLCSKLCRHNVSDPTPDDSACAQIGGQNFNGKYIEKRREGTTQPCIPRGKKRFQGITVNKDITEDSGVEQPDP